MDFAGINGYNWGTSVVLPYWSSSWQSFTQVFQYSYDELAARTVKPIMITEMGSTEKGGGKAVWTTDTFSKLKTRFPRVVSLTWFKHQQGDRLTHSEFDQKPERVQEGDPDYG